MGVPSPGIHAAFDEGRPLGRLVFFVVLTVVLVLVDSSWLVIVGMSIVEAEAPAIVYTTTLMMPASPFLAACRSWTGCPGADTSVTGTGTAP